jgi:hypothetical protein
MQIVWRSIMNEKRKVINHYVYKITDPVTGQFYYGSRSCECNPNDDVYIGSPYTWKPEDKSRLVKEIIKSDFNTRDDAMQYESDIIGRYINDPLNENYHIPSKGFHVNGRVSVKDKYGNTFSVSVDDERFLSGELKHITHGNDNYFHGKVTVRDGNNNTFQVELDNPRYINGELKHNWEGRYHTDKTKEIMSKNNGRPWLGKSLSDEHRKKISESMMGKRGHNTGNKHSLETRIKMSEANRGKLNRMAKPVLQFSLDGEFIQRWDYINQAVHKLNIKNITSCCKGRQKTAGGYVWKYENSLSK